MALKMLLYVDIKKQVKFYAHDSFRRLAENLGQH
jgi:hypothetical protein